MLHDFIRDNRDRIIAHARGTVAQRSAPQATEDELLHGVPMFLTQLVAILSPISGTPPSPADAQPSATARGGELLRRGFTVGQVVHDYGRICQAITALADDTDEPISALEFRALNQALDDAIALAVTEYARQRERGFAEAESERMTILARELRNLVSSATLAFEAIKVGSVGVGGSTGLVVSRSLAGIGQVLDRNISHLRLELGLCVLERFPLAILLEEIEIATASEALRRSIRFSIGPVDYAVDVLADRQLLAAAIENLLQCALRHTTSGAQITLRATSDATKVVLEIEDACGGLAPGAAARMLEAVTTSTDGSAPRRMSVARRALEACGATFHVSDRPAIGCLFTIELARSAPTN